ncbi:hypothetical protein SRHO_G00041140 [Serrasalmus rhombeus]
MHRQRWPVFSAQTQLCRTIPALETLLGENIFCSFVSVLSHMLEKGKQTLALHFPSKRIMKEHTRFQLEILVLSHMTTARAKLRVLASFLPLAGDSID